MFAFCSYMLYPLNLIFSLEEFCDFAEFFSMWADWVFGCFADCDNGYNSLCFRDVQNLTESTCFTESHDQSGQTEICGFQNEIFVLQTKIVTSPSIAQLIISSSILLETSTVMHKSSHDQSSMLRFSSISCARKTP